MKIEITSMTENDDGSADISLIIDYDAILFLAQVGLNKVILDAVERQEAANGYTDPEGEGDPETGAGGDQAIL